MSEIFLLACAVCYGDPNSPMVIGANRGVLFMLGVIVTMMIVFGVFFIYLWRRGAVHRVGQNGRQS